MSATGVGLPGDHQVLLVLSHGHLGVDGLVLAQGQLVLRVGLGLDGVADLVHSVEGAVLPGVDLVFLGPELVPDHEQVRGHLGGGVAHGARDGEAGLSHGLAGQQLHVLLIMLGERRTHNRVALIE